ncbi:MAG: glutamine--fructose-6-phosphate transaminase (isomerizing) [Patescibacteria group bacterium]
MCGIVGYIGSKSAKPILLDGLKKLEYRGYDSAGIAIFENDGIQLEKRKGKIAVLEEALKDKEWKGTVGISHTRWATHGKPSSVNAHPHTDCKEKIAIVHNGIIENYLQIKNRLIEKGHNFITETDSEVLAHLIEEEYHGDLSEALRSALTKVEGTYGIVVMHSDHPNLIITARKGSPVVIGIGEGENFVASDVTPLISHTKNVVYLDDEEIAEISADKYRIFTIGKEERNHEVSKIDWGIEDAEKKNYDHFMQKEIFEEGDAVYNAMRGRVIPEEGIAHLGGLNMTEDEMRAVKRIVIIACGTAHYAGRVGEYMIERYANIPVEVEYASEFRYRDPVIDEGTIVFAISQSGETADTLAAMQEAKRRGARVLGIVNTVGSTIARESDGGTYIHAGPEIGVASTKAFSGQLTALAILALQFGRLRDMSVSTGRKLVKELIDIPEKIESILTQNDFIKKLSEKYSIYEDFFFLGRGINYPIALEGALKLKEISYVHAEAYPMAELKHGPIALIDDQFPCVVVVPKDDYYDKNISNIQEIKARDGKIIAIATEGDKEISKLVDDVIYIPPTMDLLLPLLTIVPLHLFAYHMAVKLGRDVDKPRNLAKSVTVE